jgi:HAD superfamily hydrolase (TIGR01509 family)
VRIKIDAIIFDLDGVLIDSGDDIANAVIHTIKKLNTKMLAKKEIISHVGNGLDYLIRKAFEGCDEGTIETAKTIYRKNYFENSTVYTHLNKNVLELLEHFKEKKLAVLTNKPEEQAKIILEKLNVLKYFEIVYGPESVTQMKPAADGIIKILDEFGVLPGKALIIGDSYSDVLAGKNAGIHTCGVTFGLGSVDDLKESDPEMLIDDMHELIEIIE